MSITNVPTTNPASDVSRSVREKHKEYLLPATIQYYKEPLVLTEGKGLRVRDADGNTYLDFFGGILTVSVGHANEKVNAAIVAQIGRLSHVSSLYPTLPVVELAERLARLAPGRLQQCFLAASGTEADETAVMLAQLSTGTTEIVALRHGYSGRSMLAQSLTAQSTWRPLPTQVAGIKHAVSPYCYRCPLKLTYPSCGVACAKDLEELIRTTTSGRIAAFLAEPIQGVGGFITPPREYFEIAVSIIRKYGGVFICDEVQTGFGRTGGTMWGIEHWGVEPDILTMAKGIANGLPLGATITTPEIASSLKALTISTFGGNPVSCAAANATLTIIEEEKLPANAQRMGELLREGLERLQRRYPRSIGQVRGMGLMQALELVEDETTGNRTPARALTARVFEETKKLGLLIGKGGLEGNCFRIAPALNVGRAEIEEALALLEEAFATAGAR
jgi:alanine-glyoxylate transaminase / (R)-3-amino-2-methylpropionate-pyruvate transaminase